MKEEILVNVASGETRVAIVENGVLQEVLIERVSRLGLVSNIYKGKVSRVLPGMQAAFIEIGLERTAFLHVSDIARPSIEEDGVAIENNANIRDLLRDGDSVLVQVVKDPMGTKGARLTTFITIPSRYLVYMPNGSGVGVSTRIDDEQERARLRDTVAQFIDPATPGGYIVRTAAEGAPFEALRADMLFLAKLWKVVFERGNQSDGPDLIYEDLPLHKRILRDVLNADIEKIRVDSEAAFEGMQKFANTFIPELAPTIDQYSGDRPLFDLHNVEEEIQKALERKVTLKSGGYLIIDQTEAMTTVDVNTGAYVGHRNLEDTIFKTNLEAAQAIARQLRLRNLGGIIILDFIDMHDEEHRRQVLQALEKYLSRDHVKFFISEVTQLGLVEMTRKRTRESLQHITCEPCASCNGRGFIKTAETVCYEIFREIVRQNRQFDFQELMILASQEVTDMLLDEESAALADLELATGKPIRLQPEISYQTEVYDVVLM
ncbi:MAG: ribonuclease G [Gammaproteobacteria bacterium]|nr:ribonuclease G [Gammaproteobacteria bacterium]